MATDDVRDMPYAEVDTIHNDPEHPLPVYERVCLLSELSREAIKTLLEIAAPDADTPLLMVELRRLLGVPARRAHARDRSDRAGSGWSRRSRR